MVFSSLSPSTCLLLALQMCAPPPHPSRGHISRYVAARAKLNSREQVLFPVCQAGSDSTHVLNRTLRALITFNSTLWHPSGVRADVRSLTLRVSPLASWSKIHICSQLWLQITLDFPPRCLWHSGEAQLLETLILNWDEISALADDSPLLALCLINAVFTAPQSSLAWQLINVVLPKQETEEVAPLSLISALQ